MDANLTEALAVKTREQADAAKLSSGDASQAVTDLEAISSDTAYSAISQNATFKNEMSYILNQINTVSTTSSGDSIEDNYGVMLGYNMNSSIASNGVITTSTVSFDPGHNFGTDNLSQMYFLTGGDKFLLANLLYASSYCQSGVGEGVFQPGSWVGSNQSLSINGQPCTQNTLSAPGQVLTVKLQCGATATIGMHANNNATISFSGPASAFNKSSADCSALIRYLEAAD